MEGVSSADPTLALYLKHRGSLVNYANGIVRDRAGAEDVVQEAYLRFSSASSDERLISNPVSYLYRIVRNLALDWVNRTSETASTGQVSALEQVAQEGPTAEDVLHYRDELRVLADALAELPERTRIAFTMYRLEGCTLQQVGDRLGVSIVRAHQLVKDAILHAARRLDSFNG
ncbi:sigma-70 family RNA polymerase sigma factor [Reyranella sp.]|uniref:sigma-70 family RNA polymerase sigma factor n=1 Tax=Reyranella sp. TaxID=1929291 RepID=UPI002726055C|nr:sigma-70 family RNA polymerase sigma factor [Reyranella sp.]MDO8974499.1 sigma-70 family RNA polymerase sigma factor [Reyranella sp.]MDP3238826.1 sigma-70 family RNA polymerase sigma factor [Reyranella sp.]